MMNKKSRLFGRLYLLALVFSISSAPAVAGEWTWEPVGILKDSVGFFMNNPRLTDASSWIQELNLDENSTEATLTGDTTDGKHILGTDTVNIVPKAK